MANTLFKTSKSGDKIPLWEIVLADEQNKAIWLDKESVVGKLATIKYQELTPDGIPRFGVFKAIRDGE